jgi:selenide,water dikinase
MKTDLLSTVESGGCSSKIPPKVLEDLLKSFPLPADPKILVNIDTHDDAGVYKVNDELALVFTTDFFPPVCSDPYEFGRIAAANSVSDIYAMGGTPVIALNIMMFPSKGIPLEAYTEILRGGSDLAAEAGLSIIGGHSIDDYPPKYGLAVIGYVHPEKIVTNSGVKEGDVLILTKAVGTGVILAAQRLGLASEDNINEAKLLMMQLNNKAAEIMKLFGIRGATDITGFGLAGHTLKMARASGVSITLNMQKVPLLSDAYSMIDQGCIPGAAFRNLDYAEADTGFSTNLVYNLKMAAFDAQTSGGLLMSVREEKASEVLDELHRSGLPAAAIIGKASARREKLLYLEQGD